MLKHKKKKLLKRIKRFKLLKERGKEKRKAVIAPVVAQ